MPNPSIKNEKMYEELRGKAIRSRSPPDRQRRRSARQVRCGQEGREVGPTTTGRSRAQDAGQGTRDSGYSDLSKDQLISKIRNSWRVERQCAKWRAPVR